MLLKFSRDVAMATKFWISYVNYTKSNITSGLCTIAFKFLLLVWVCVVADFSSVTKFLRDVAMVTKFYFYFSEPKLHKINNNCGPVHRRFKIFAARVEATWSRISILLPNFERTLSWQQNVEFQWQNCTKLNITPVLYIVASKFLLLEWGYRGQEFPLCYFSFQGRLPWQRNFGIA